MSALTLDSVLLVRPGVHVVVLDDEKVVFVRDHDTLHRLDPMAALVWDCLSPPAPLGTIVDDLTEAFGADRARVTNDVLTLAGNLFDAGALTAADDVGDLPRDA